jgi:hypothetical protein
MAKYTMVFHGFLGNEESNQWPLSQEKEYDEYPVVPRIGEEVITRFGTAGSDSRWLVRAVRHLVREGQSAEGAIVDLIPVCCDLWDTPYLRWR